MPSRITPATLEHKPLLRNMMQLYLHDMSVFAHEGKPLEINDDGLYKYRYLDLYWTEETRFPYLMWSDGRPVGFCLIRQIEEIPRTHSVTEFFILRNYRHQGLGQQLIGHILNQHPGHWLIATSTKNIQARHFWCKVVIQHHVDGFDESMDDLGQSVVWQFRKG